MLNVIKETPFKEESLEEGFEKLNLIEPLVRAVHAEGYTQPTPIQKQTIPHLLEGKDLLGCAQTGTGKTAAFALPILQKLAAGRKNPGPKGARVLILAPTRELAVQIDESFRIYGRHLKVTRALVYGGVKPRPQIKAMARGVDILVATPGRLLDLINQRCIQLNSVEVFVLDEADRMLDMGFLPDIKKIYDRVPEKRQSMLFSATFPDEIMRLTEQFLKSPVSVAVTPPSRTVQKIDQRILFVDKENKCALLESFLMAEGGSRTLIFTRTKHGADRVAKNLKKIRIKAGIIHGNKSQAARLSAIQNFRSGKASVLVATDIAARGLDIDGITHVINYDLPAEAESYVHRIGRTARAGATGTAISFCDAKERGYLRRIEKAIDQVVEVDSDHPFHSWKAQDARGPKPASRRNGGGNRNVRKRTSSSRQPGKSGRPAKRPQRNFSTAAAN